ncbi:unnamed protein product, partial [Mesorhabditis belari]|uniref:protein-tyrosine-phosphatase n=1 Tax=Mesorhabditis belari TaxID=2138241 RepID=A0AAF3F7S1_9BILA
MHHIISFSFLFSAFAQVTSGSSIFLDWSSEVPNGGVRAYVLDYSPPVGIPPAGTHLSRTTQQLLLNQTIPAADYSVYLTALMIDGTRRNVSEKHLPSSPNPPILDTIETSASDATLSYFPPEGQDISYYIEYFPLDREEYANFVETKSLLVKLRGLDPSTTFRLRILSVFRGVPSTESIDTTFMTKDLGKSVEDLGMFTIKTLPPDFDLATATLTPKNIDGSKEYEYMSKEESQTQTPTNGILEEQRKEPTGETEYYYQETSVTSEVNESTTPSTLNVQTPKLEIVMITENFTEMPTTKQSTVLSTIITTEPTTIEVHKEVETKTIRPIVDDYDNLEQSQQTMPDVTNLSMTKKAQLKVTRRPVMSTSDENNGLTNEWTITTKTSTSPIQTTTTSPIQTTTTLNKELVYEYEEMMEKTKSTHSITKHTNGPKTTELVEKEVVDYGPEIGEPITTTTRIPEKDEYGEPGAIWLSKEGKMLKLEWDVSEGSLCDAFLLNYTVLSLSQPKAFSIATQETFALIKMFTDHKIEMKVFCMLAGSLSKTWWAHRLADLSKPRSIHGLKAAKVETDEFYVASIELSWDWPDHHDFEFYDLSVHYGVGKAPPKEIEVKEKGKVLIDKLESTQEYTITVRNVSRELSIASSDATIKQLTPPIISSTLYPGQISSTSININFGESDPEQGKFDHYELDFTGNNKNISRKIGMDKERSFTFTKLIPGKTYHFALYTVYQGLRSRPVKAEVTTYPLKVEKLHPIIGKDYAMLYWDIENFADNDVRFRLSYTAKSNNGASKERTVQLKNVNHFRFEELDLETYYTFTITVIMGLGDSEAESESETITVAFGNDVRSRPSLKRHGTRELALIFENDHTMWHELNGPFNNFAVIVTEDIELGGDEWELRSWFEVHNDETWPAYRASKSNYQPFQKRGVKEATFVIGEDDCEQQKLDEPYCNGMLRANTKYLAKVRGYTDEGVAMETEWVAIHGQTDGEDGEEGEEEDDKGLPCHMYLNGCPRKGSEKSGGFWKSIMSALGFLGR